MPAPPLIAGSRVLLTKTADDFYLGTVIHNEGASSMVSLDIHPFKPDKFLKFKNSILQPVKYFKLQTSRTKFTDILPDFTDPHKMFLNKGNVKFDLAAVRAMYAWTNLNLFGSKLKYPNLTSDGVFIGEDGKRKPAFGFFTTYDKKTKQPTINIKIDKMINMRQCFITTVHEMVHEANWEFDKVGGHGTKFKAWAPKVQSVCGVELNVLSDTPDMETEFQREDLNSSGAEFYVFVLNNMYAVKSNNLDTIEATRDFFLGYSTFIRKVKNPKLYTIIKTISKPTAKIKSFTPIDRNLVELLLEQGTPAYSSQLVLR